MSTYTRRRPRRLTPPASRPRGTRIATVIVAAVFCVATSVAAATPDPEQPPAGTTMVVVLTSDGMAWLPVAAVPVPPTACDP